MSSILLVTVIFAGHDVGRQSSLILLLKEETLAKEVIEKIRQEAKKELEVFQKLRKEAERCNYRHLSYVLLERAERVQRDLFKVFSSLVEAEKTYHLIMVRSFEKKLSRALTRDMDSRAFWSLSSSELNWTRLMICRYRKAAAETKKLRLWFKQKSLRAGDAEIQLTLQGAFAGVKITASYLDGSSLWESSQQREARRDYLIHMDEVICRLRELFLLSP